MFDNIFSVESIVSLAITITVSFAVTFKIIKLNLTIKNKSHTIKGDGNSIEHNEFNIVMKETQGEFRNLSLLLGGIIILLLPYCGSFVNYFLYNFSRIAPYFCVVGIVFTLWARGFSNRFFDCFYIVPTLFNVYFASRAAENSYYFMSHFDGLYDRILSSFVSILFSAGKFEYFSNSIFYFLEQNRYFFIRYRVCNGVCNVVVCNFWLYKTTQFLQCPYIRFKKLHMGFYWLSDCFWDCVGVVLWTKSIYCKYF
ncbi:hypothetical protein ACK99G_23240 [Klebsiella pneumoniae]|uniref:hypothetical protein n=1 Tax=Klebsiella pneumoniae TaxID=573 RepID=UPI003987103E